MYVTFLPLTLSECPRFISVFWSRDCHQTVVTTFLLQYHVYYLVQYLCVRAHIHLTDQKVTMILYNSRQSDGSSESPLIKGKIQLQSEGAELFYRNLEVEPISAIPKKMLANKKYSYCLISDNSLAASIVTYRHEIFHLFNSCGINLSASSLLRVS